MTTWSSSLLTRFEKHLHASQCWRKSSDIAFRPPKPPKSIHLAVFVQPFLQFVLDGRKTVESRFSIHRRPPFGCVRSGDLVLIKESGGPVVAMAEVSHVWYYRLDPSTWEFIRSKFAEQLCAEDPEFWKSKASSYFATLMQFARVDKLDPLECSKRDRRGWVVLDGSTRQADLFSGIDLPKSI
jgi:hypothetical protein